MTLPSSPFYLIIEGIPAIISPSSVLSAIIKKLQYLYLIFIPL